MYIIYNILKYQKKLIVVCGGGCVYVCLCKCVYKPEDSLVGLVLSIHFHMGSGDGTPSPDLIHKPLPAEPFLQPETLTSWCWESETGF